MAVLDHLPTEFDRITRHFRPLAAPEALDLLDDAALIDAPRGRSIVLTTDAIVAGVHFIPSDPPDMIARKLMRVNLSDLAAKGARPLGYLLTIAVPRDTPDGWFAAFASGLAADQATYGLGLLGGDTTSTSGPVTLSMTMIGHVAQGRMIRRNGAVPGDLIWVTGTIGDGALGLAVATGLLPPDPQGYLLERYLLPRPRIGLRLRGIVSAGMDVSDGLVQDLGHICRASGLSATIEAGAVPLSAAAAAAGPAWREMILTGGDDYELLLAVPPDEVGALRRVAEAADVPVSCIGRFTAGPPVVTVRDETGQALSFAKGGWSHLSA